MTVQLAVVGEIVQQLGHNTLLLLGQFVRMYRIHCREIHILHSIILLSYTDCTMLEIYLVQQVAV